MEIILNIKEVNSIFVEINLRKNKILLIGAYHSTNDDYGTTDEVFFQEIGLAIDVHYSSYNKFLLAGDFNMNVDSKKGHGILDEFMSEFLAKNLVKGPTCFKSTNNPSCIDLFITNSYESLKSLLRHQEVQ